MTIINGTAASETLLGGAGNDTITGAGGNDLARMGDGDDLFIWSLGDGSDKVEGQAGFDTLRFTASAVGESINVTANGTRSRVTGAAVAMDLNGVERIELQALAGSDDLRVFDLSATHVRQVAIDLAGTVGGVVGDGAFDVVSRYGSDGDDIFNVALAGGKVSVTGLSTQVTISHADTTDALFISGGWGNDIIDASALAAGAVKLDLDGDLGNDKLIGSKGDDYVMAGVGNDTVIGGAGNDTALLGAGNDLFLWNPSDGSDTIYCQAGFDTVRVTGSNVNESFIIAPNGGRAALFRDVGAVFLDIDDGERLQVRALGGADSIVVNDLIGTNVKEVAIDLAAAAGGTLADSKVDVVTVGGLATDDFIDVTWTGGKVVASGLTASVSVAHAGATDILAISGGDGSDVINAGALPAGKMSLQLLGGDGDDVILGSAGADAVRGGVGNDVAFLGAGNDVFFWNSGDGSDRINGEAGFDSLQFTGANVIETISILEGSGGHAQVTRDVASITMDLDGVERIRVQALDSADNVIVGDLAGTDVKQVAIDLAAAVGGTVGDGQQDFVTAYGTFGNDIVTLAMSGGAVSVTGLPAQVTIAHADGIDFLTLFGNAGNDTFDASTVPASALRLNIDGGDGNDLLSGSAGDNNLAGDNGNDTVRGGGGNDILLGELGNDRLEGGAGVDNVFGGNGKDVILGGSGDDALDGGWGNDTITGGVGNDTIRYTSTLDGHDVILDFDGDPTGGQDVLNMDALFDALGVLTADRLGRVQITDLGATVDVAVDADGNAGNGFELVVATLYTTDVITKGIGQDVLVGTL